jgi:hypothetical protein
MGSLWVPLMEMSWLTVLKEKFSFVMGFFGMDCEVGVECNEIPLEVMEATASSFAQGP